MEIDRAGLRAMVPAVRDAVRDAGPDCLPMLVYADVAEEAGLEDHARHIRNAVDRYQRRGPHYRYLAPWTARRSGRVYDWWPGFRGRFVAAGVDRGFVETAHAASVLDLFRWGDEMLLDNPVRRVVVARWANMSSTLVSTTDLEFPFRVDMHVGGFGDQDAVRVVRFLPEHPPDWTDREEFLRFYFPAVKEWSVVDNDHR